MHFLSLFSTETVKDQLFYQRGKESFILTKGYKIYSPDLQIRKYTGTSASVTGEKARRASPASVRVLLFDLNKRCVHRKEKTFSHRS